MRLYTVLAPATAPGETPEPASLVFVREGFCWPALIVPELWLLFRRMWIVLAFYVAAIVFVVAFGMRFGAGLAWLLVALGHLYMALEGNELRRWTLARRGFGLFGVVEARNPREAELRFFLEWPQKKVAADAAPEPLATPKPPVLPPAPPPPPALPPPSLANRPVAEVGDVVGFFPAPGGAS